MSTIHRALAPDQARTAFYPDVIATAWCLDRLPAALHTGVFPTFPTFPTVQR